MKLENRVAIVTGATRGIGNAVAELFAMEGATVIVVSGSSIKSAEQACEGIEKRITRGHETKRVFPFKTDVSKSEEVHSLVDYTISNFGKIDILVNNAGILELASFLELSEEQFERIISVHLKGTFLCTKAVTPFMIKQGYGKIINVSAPSALRGNVGYSIYGAAKAGIVSLTRTLAKEFGHYQINVNCIIPIANTEMTTKVRAFSGKGSNTDKDVYPLGRVAEASEIAPVFLFFASRDSDYVTGQVLAADGGLTA